MIASNGVQADLLTDPLSQMKPPGKSWTTVEPEKADGTQMIMHPLKTGDAVNIRAHTYKVAASADAFIQQIRARIIQKPDYIGADVDAVEQKKIKGKRWDVFALKRKDDIKQEVWVRKTSEEVILMVIYTGGTKYFKKYHKDLMRLIKSSS